MGEDLDQWLKDRSLKLEDLGYPEKQSILDLPLFPVAEPEDIPVLLEFILRGRGKASGWLQTPRISARQISQQADIPALYIQRKEFKTHTLPKLAVNHHKSIFYFLDLEKAASDYRDLGLDLPGELESTEPVLKRINDQMFRARVSGNRELASVYENNAFKILRESMIDSIRSETLQPERNILDDQILWGRSPVRLDLAGGWTDTPPYCIMEGGKVINISVELNGQLPLQVYARPLKEHKIILRSIDLGEKAEITEYEDLKRYDRLGGVFSIPMAALVLAGFGPEFTPRSYSGLGAQLKAFGCGIELSLLSAIPKGSGLGTSSNLAATVLGTLNEFCKLNWDRHEVAYRTLILEQMLTTGGGWQDQYGGIFEGIKLLETSPGVIQKPSIKWIPDQLFHHPDTRGLILLYYTGVTRVARDILGEIVKGMFLNSSRHLEIFTEMQSHAKDTFEVMLRNDYEGLAGKVAKSWELNQRLDEGTNPPVIEAITRLVDDHLLGYKLLGAGGGGYLMMFAKSLEAAGRVRKILEKDPPNTRARFVEFKVSQTGFQVSRS
jgi:galactokinase/mevalonate kinase-like predicted kinase